MINHFNFYVVLILKKCLPFYLLVLLFLSTGCSSNSSPSYSAAIAEGRAAVQEIMTSSEASAISIVLVDENGLAWAQAFGKANREADLNATTDTLFAICSVSKMFATVTVMMLVEENRVSLEEPVTTYISNFSMPLDPRYLDITVRMLLNHLSGLPGFDGRGATTSTPFPGYAAQVMEGLRYQRLKHDPGLLAAYNNDGFTMAANVVTAVTGEDYPSFVRRKILTPLSMNLSRYNTEPLPQDSYAQSYSQDTLLPQMTLNVYGTGGLFSTPQEMSHLLTMLINKGVYSNRRILSAQSIAAMGQDQTLASFNPVPNEAYRYGLGWDTVAQPGLAAVGVTAWQKTGDMSGYYGASIIVLPEEKLGMVVLGASNRFTSDYAVKISERILLRALVERGRLAAMPQKLSTASLPLMAVTPEDKNTFAGFYASTNLIYRVSYKTDDSLNIDEYQGAWTPKYRNFKLRSDGWYAADGSPIPALKLLTRTGHNYLAVRENRGAGHYSTTSMLGQRLEDKPDMSAAWQTRLNERWLPVNDDQYIQFPEVKNDPVFALETITDLTGYVMGKNILCAMTPPSDERLTGTFLKLPFAGKDMKDADMETRNSEKWLRHGSYLFRPLSGVELLATGPATVSIGSEGLAEWRSLPSAGTLSINGAMGWLLYDANFVQIAHGGESGSASFSGTGAKYLFLYGTTGSTINLNLTIP
jgi:CubicO group peptidase (beta-lactamase class C family)